MANNQTKGSGIPWNQKFRSFGNSIQKTMNDFTGIDKSTRSYRSATVSTMNSGSLPSSMNNTKSASGARQYQSGRRRSIDRTSSGHNSHSSSMINIDTTHQYGHSRGSSISSQNFTGHPSMGPAKYQKRRKRSLLIGRESYKFTESTSPKSDRGGISPTNSPNSPSGNQGLGGPKLPSNFYPPEAFVNFLYRVSIYQSLSISAANLRNIDDI